MDVKRIYEAMFLFDTVTGNNAEKVSEIINRLMERSDSELISQTVWDERRLAYEIQGHRRGVYVLAFFRTSPDKIDQIERDIRLSGDVLRALILKRDKLTEQQIKELTERTEAIPEEEVSVETELPAEEELTPIALEVTETAAVESAKTAETAEDTETTEQADAAEQQDTEESE